MLYNGGEVGACAHHSGVCDAAPTHARPCCCCSPAHADHRQAAARHLAEEEPHRRGLVSGGGHGAAAAFAGWLAGWLALTACAALSLTRAAPTAATLAATQVRGLPRPVRHGHPQAQGRPPPGSCCLTSPDAAAAARALCLLRPLIFGRQLARGARSLAVHFVAPPVILCLCASV